MKRIKMFLTNRKSIFRWLCLLCSLILLISYVACGGLKYDRIHSISGGGTCSGGSFTLTGTIGQPIVGTCSGGPFVLASGFRRSPKPPSLPTGDLEGLVLDLLENPIHELYTPTVTVIDSRGRTISTVTDSNGYFLITGLNIGLATVTAQATGYQPDTQTVNIVADTKSQLLFMLQP
jgi:hypothetical protein